MGARCGVAPWDMDWGFADWPRLPSSAGDRTFNVRDFSRQMMVLVPFVLFDVYYMWYM